MSGNAPLAVVFTPELLLLVHRAVYCPKPLKSFTSYTPNYAQRELLISLSFYRLCESWRRGSPYSVMSGHYTCLFSM